MKRFEILDKLENILDSTDEKLNDISNFLNNLLKENREKSYFENGVPTDLGYTLAYLDEIEFTSRCFNEVLRMMCTMIYYEEGFILITTKSIFKLWFFTVRFMGDNYQKQLSERLKNIGVKINIETNNNTSKDMHDISNRYNYFLANGEDITQEYIVEYTFYLAKNYIILLDKFFEIIQTNDLKKFKKFLSKKERKSNGKTYKSIINKLKDNGAKLEKDIDKVEEFLKHSDILKTEAELNTEIETLEKKFINLKNSKKIKELDRIKLISDSLFRISEAMHLLNINNMVHREAKLLNGDTNYIYKHNVIINHSILLISSCYDKLAKELIGDIKGKEIYFSTIQSQNQLRRCYQGKFNLVEINKFRKKIFELRNEFIHIGVPYRTCSDKSFIEQATIYQVDLIKINASYLIPIIDSIIENIN